MGPKGRCSRYAFSPSRDHNFVSISYFGAIADEPAAPANKEVSLPLKRTLKESSHYPTRSDPDKKYTDSYISPATIPFPTPVVPSPAMPYYSSPHYSQNYISHHHRRSSPVTIYSPPPYIQSWPSPSPPPLLHHPDRQMISYGLQSHASNMYGNGGYRGDRPYEWRRDFSTRSGLSWLVPRSQNSFSRAGAYPKLNQMIGSDHYTKQIFLAHTSIPSFDILITILQSYSTFASHLATSCFATSPAQSFPLT